MSTKNRRTCVFCILHIINRSGQKIVYEMLTQNHNGLVIGLLKFVGTLYRNGSACNILQI